MEGNSRQTRTSGGNINNNIIVDHIEHFNQTINSTAGTSTRTTDVVIDFCPAPVSTFLGRSGDLATLKSLFTQHQVVALVGMGGLGKTQLSRKYVLVNKEVYQYKYWLESETPEKLKNSFKELAKILDITSDNIDKVVNDVYKRIQAAPTILVFDNVEKPADVYAYLPTRVVLPPGVTIHVLVTSRWADWTCDKRIKCQQLQPLNVAESLKIFEEKFGESCIETMQKEWKKLAEMLGHLPLALQVATSYIHKLYKHNSDLRKVLDDYMKQVTKGARRLLNDPLPEYDNKSVYASMLLTLEQLEHKTGDEWKLAVTLINAAAYMDPDSIYKQHLLKWLDDDDNTSILDEALVILTESSLFNHRDDCSAENNIYSVHRIIQSSIRHNQTENKTADIHYTRILNNVCANNYYSTYLFQCANERASAVVRYYEENPTPRLLEYLVKYRAITAVQGIFKLMTREQIQSLINQEDLLYWAVDSEYLSIIQLLCNTGADINQLCGASNVPPLHRAVRRGKMDIVKWLLQSGASPTVRDAEGSTALHLAAMCVQHILVPFIIQADRAVVHATDNAGNTPLLRINYSMKEEDILSNISALIENGADITTRNKLGNTVLHRAAGGACAAAVKLILQQNKYLINITNKTGETALHVIPYDDTFVDDERILSTTRALAEGGADLTTVDVRGDTVLHSAARGACAAAVTLILQLNIHLINITNKTGETALHVIPYDDIFANDERILSTTRALAEGGADLTTVDVLGDTVLHSAARNTCAAAVTLILQLNEHLINIANKNGETALHVIPYNDRYIKDARILSTTRALAEGGADLTTVDVRGDTVLHSAARNTRAAAVTLILQLNKYLINITNKTGETALHVIPYGNIFVDDERILSTTHALAEGGADLTTADVRGDTVLHRAARCALAAAVTLILQQNEHLINIANKKGQTALHVLGNGYTGRIYFLDMVKTEKEREDLFVSIKEIARLLIMNGLSLDTKDKKGRTPLATVRPAFKEILRQVADECNNQLLVYP